MKNVNWTYNHRNDPEFGTYFCFAPENPEVQSPYLVDCFEDEDESILEEVLDALERNNIPLEEVMENTYECEDKNVGSICFFLESIGMQRDSQLGHVF